MGLQRGQHLLARQSRGTQDSYPQPFHRQTIPTTTVVVTTLLLPPPFVGRVGEGVVNVSSLADYATDRKDDTEDG